LRRLRTGSLYSQLVYPVLIRAAREAWRSGFPRAIGPADWACGEFDIIAPYAADVFPDDRLG